MGRKPSKLSTVKSPAAKPEIQSIQPDPINEAAPALPADDPGFRVNGREGAEKKLDSVSVKLAEDGSIHPSTRPSTLERLRDVIAKSPQLQIGGGATAQFTITADKVEPFYTGIGLVNTFLAIRLLKMDAQIAGTVIPYNRDELALLSEATASAINENIDKCPAWLLKLLQGGGSVALAKLAMVLFQVHAQKFQAVRQAIQQQREGQTAVQ